MNKTELIAKIAERLDTTKVEAKRFVDTTFDAMYNTLVDGEEVTIAGFGAFKIKERSGRTGHNPKTGESIEIAPCKAIGFKPTSALKEAVKGL